VVERATAFMDAYQFDKAMREIEVFMWHEFADHYIEMVKHRKDDSMRYALYTVGLGLAELMAPFMPHVTEEIFDRTYRSAEGGTSIHISRWPQPMPRDADIEKKGAVARDAIATLRAWKGTKGLRLGQPMGVVHIFGKDSGMLDDFQDDIKGTLKAREVLLARPEGLREEPDRLVPVRQKIGPVFKGRANAVVDAIGKLVPKEAAGHLASAGKLELALADGSKAEIAPDMVRVEMRSMVGDARVDVVLAGEMTILVETGK
jgi:valyl-tRNA synthetase